MAEPTTDEPAMSEVADPEARHLLGLFDAPAYARRGQDLEYALDRLHGRCRRERDELLAMVRLRLRQWAASAGPDRGADAFVSPIDTLWELTGADAPRWSAGPLNLRHRRAAARDLAASVARFNARWSRFLGGLDLGPINRQIDKYNRYYLLEKECSLGSARLASRHFAPRAYLDAGSLLRDHPLLPAPVPRD